LKLLYVANPDSIHTKKWCEYFLNKYGTIDLIKGESVKEIKDHIKSFKPDIMHVHYAGYGALYAVCSGFRPLVLTVWGSDVLLNQKIWWKRQALKYILHNSDLITCDAQHMVQALINLDYPIDKIYRINFGVDVDKFKPNPISHDRPTVISLRSLEPIYDIKTLINAVPLVVKEIPNVLFKIIGDGSKEIELKRYSLELHVEDNVLFYGKASNNEIPMLLHLSDLYVSTSLSDAGIASSTAEAMACGLPVLVSDSGENHLWIENTFDCGDKFIFKCGDYKTLANQIVMILKVPHDIGWGKENRNIIVNQDNYKVEMAKMAKIYEELNDRA
jgi:glycosyltransferase involved in cell wall biosynthesis